MPRPTHDPFAPFSDAPFYEASAPTLDLDVESGAERKQELPTVDTTNTETVPNGTIKDVLTWVDGDKDRANAALEVEQAGAKRTSLIDKLEDVIKG